MIPVNKPLLNGNENAYLTQCIESGWISSEGPFVTEFETKFAQRIGVKHGISVCNGTAAIDAVIEALEISKGDEVILPAFTIISCVNQIIRSGAIPVLVDSDPITWNMDVTQIEAKITNRTRAIMVVHTYGMPVDMDTVLKIAQKHSLHVIEDAAEAHGQTYRGIPCGSLGTISTFSFYPNKHVTTGEGGMILCNDDHLAETCRSLRNLCFKPEQRFVHESLGWNLRMTNLQAAVGVAQLERLDEFIHIKKRMGANYTELLKDVADVQLPIPRTVYAENHYWVFGILIRENRHHNAKSAIESLRERGIGCRPFFCPLHMQPVLRKYGLKIEQNFPVAENLYRNGFYIPSGLGLTRDELEIVAEAVAELFQ